VGAGVLPAEGVAIVGPHGVEGSAAEGGQRLVRGQEAELHELTFQNHASDRRLRV
jgi:hypothetical protein